MSAASRSKGKRGQLEFKRLLQGRDWVVAETGAGESVEDFWATDEAGKTWSVEVKNRKSIDFTATLKQTRENAAKSRKPWLLACKLPGLGEWLVMRQGERSTVWR